MSTEPSSGLEVRHDVETTEPSRLFEGIRFGAAHYAEYQPSPRLELIDLLATASTKQQRLAAQQMIDPGPWDVHVFSTGASE